MYWSPNFLTVVFKKQEISQQVFTRMQDVASEFSKKISRDDTPDPQSGRGDPSRTQHPERPFAGRGVQAPRCWDPNLGPPHGSYSVPGYKLSLVCPCLVRPNEIVCLPCHAVQLPARRRSYVCTYYLCMCVFLYICMCECMCVCVCVFLLFGEIKGIYN